MTILYLCDKNADYGADFLYDGFCDLLGPGNVVDWPSKPSLHGRERDRFDCDLGRPTHAWTEDAVMQALREGTFDLIVVPTLRGAVRERLIRWATVGLIGNNASKIVYYDGEDHCHDTLPAVIDCLGCEPAAYFKRELPIGENWAVSLPFGYPARRCVNRTQDEGPRAPHVFYAVQVWEWARGGMRERLATQLAREFRGSSTVAAFDEQSAARRWAPHEYHERLARASVSVVPAGQGYFTNRLFESLAAGCAVVAEAPTVTFPDALIDGVECLYFRNEFQAIETVGTLLADPEYAWEIARAGRAALLSRHSTKCRAETMMRVVEERRAAT